MRLIVRTATLTKSHVDAFTRKDGTLVQAHDDKRVASTPAKGSTIKPKGGDVGGGLWRTGHKVKLHDPGTALHGVHGEVTGGHESHSHVTVKTSDGKSYGMHSASLRPADGHSWPDMDDHSQTVKAPAAAAAPKKAVVRKPKAKTLFPEHIGEGFHGSAVSNSIKKQHGADTAYSDLTTEERKPHDKAAAKEFSDAADHLVDGGHFSSHSHARDYLDSKHGRHLHDGSTVHGGVAKVPWLASDVKDYKAKTRST